MRYRRELLRTDNAMSTTRGSGCDRGRLHPGATFGKPADTDDISRATGTFGGSLKRTAVASISQAGTAFLLDVIASMTKYRDTENGIRNAMAASVHCH